MTPEAFWCSTTAELAALRDVFMEPIRRWAIQTAATMNLTLSKGELLYVPDDLLIDGHREDRVAVLKRENARAAIAGVRGQVGTNQEEPEWAHHP